MVSDMGSTGPALTGKHVRLEALEHRHVPGLVAASVGDASLYQWSPVPQGEAEAVKYVRPSQRLANALRNGSNR